MSDEARLIFAFVLGLGAAFAATPVAMAVAARTDFNDKPVGYKGHSRPTPYLGGAAVVGGFLVAALMLGGQYSRLSPIVASAFTLWALGTIDDRVGLPAWPRLLVEAGLAIVLWSSGLGWDVLPGSALDLMLTVLWVVGLVNAFNLIDNMDGAAATLAVVTGVTVGILAVIQGDAGLAILTFGLAGACLGFLPYNLGAPARIFLGDGGSLPIGFVIAAALMTLPGEGHAGVEALLVAALLAGLPILDTTLVTISRRRAGLSVFTAGRDHLTHRLKTRLGTARTVALTLGVVQTGLGAVAIGVVQLGRGSVLVAWSIWFVVATAGIMLLETAAWAPVRDPVGAPRAVPVGRARRGAGFTPSLVEAALIAFIGLSCGLSPYLYGFYDASVWGPIALGMLAALLGLLVARPAVPRRGALVAAGALAGFWLWALLSTRWAESADQAMTEANRWLLYAALFGVLVLLLRDDRLGVVLIAAGTAAILGLGGYLLTKMFAGSASELFTGGRLNGPLGYVNGQAGFLLLGMWPLVAVAERARSSLLAGAALSGATALGALVVLGQSRGVLPAILISLVVLVVAVPGRTRRTWALVFLLAGVAACLSPLLDVYNSAGSAPKPSDDVLRHAALAIVLASVVVGSFWSAASRLVALLLAPARARVVGSVSVAIVVLLAVGVGLSAVHDPVGRVKHEYRSFTQLQGGRADSSRFTTGAGNRYDYWRVAWHQFKDEPTRGVGAGNFDRTYFLQRRTTEDVRQAHSIELQALGELGLVGGALLALFVAAVLAGFWRRCRAARADPRQAGLAVAAGGAFIAWLVQTSVDWLHLIPGLTGLALCSAAVLVGPWAQSRGVGSARIRVVVVVVAAIAAAAGAILVGRVALAEHYLAQGERALAKDPDYALQKARDSLALNDESLPAYYLRSAAWARFGDYQQARAALVEATRREPHDFVTWTLLGDLATRRGDRPVARADYRRASRLNPRDRSLRALAAQPPGSR